MTHSHQASSQQRNEQRVLWAMLLTGSFMFAEVAGGLIAGSLALLADAAHMLTDCASLALAWLAFRISRRPADESRTYGYGRLQILAAFLNGILLVAVVGWIFYEALHRLLQPVEVLGGVMLAIAIAGLLVNVAAFLILHGADRDNLNIRGAALHVLGDLLGSVAVLIAALVIMTTGWTPIDPLLSMLVGLIVLRSAWFLVRKSGHVLLEGTPAHLDPAALKDDIAALAPEIGDVHHVHAWSLTLEKSLVTLHVTVAPGADGDDLLGRIKDRLAERWSVDHSVVQFEQGEACPDDDRPRLG